MATQRVVLHQITHPDQLDPRHPRAFPAAQYSDYKYGSLKAAINFAGAFVDRMPATLDTLASSAYRFMPTASHAVTQALYAHLILMRGATPRLVHIHRGQLTHGDYSTMSHEERLTNMACNGLSVDPALITGRSVVIIDDIVVTGSHEAALERLLEPLEPAELTFAYIAAIDPELGFADPTIEDRINHAKIIHLEDMHKLIVHREFTMNARSCKFILAPRHLMELPSFLSKLPDELIVGFFSGAVGDGYHTMELYRSGFAVLNAEYDRRIMHDAQLRPSAVSAQ